VNEIGRKPWINTTIFGRKIAYPKPNTVTREFLKVPGLAGVLIVSKGQPPWQGSWMGLAQWKVGEEVIADGFPFLGHDIDPSPLDAWPCPFVFGNQSRDVELIPRPDAEPLHLRLPPNHVEEPKLKPLTLPVGPWKLIFTPKEWISPSFPIRYSLTMEGASKDDWFFVSLTEGSMGTTHLRIGPEASPEFYLYDWQPRHAILVQFQKVRREPIKISVERSSFSGGAENLKFHLDDTVLENIDINHSLSSVTSTPGMAGSAISVQIGDRWITGEFGLRPMVTRMPTLSPQDFARIKDGDVVDGYRYLPDSSLGQQEAKLELPDPAKYVGTRHTVDRRAR